MPQALLKAPGHKLPVFFDLNVVQAKRRGPIMKTSYLQGKVMRNRINMAILMGAVFLGPCVYAETIVIPLGQQSAEKSGIERPHRGQLKTSVEQSFGSPRSTQGPVGDPPITAWEYEDFWVYFEYDHVLHTVLKRQPQAAAE
jgi:hypothetical protein